MDVRTGRIHEAADVATMSEQERRFMREMAVPPNPKQQRLGRVGRNDLCPCGSDKKFKKCCLRKA
jgi:uncharacterized protein YecA (UPF0149 family)